MNTRISLLSLAALCLCSLSVQAPAADLGKNLAGEACRSESAPAPDAPMAIACGTSSNPSGQIWAVSIDRPLPATPVQRRNAMTALIAISSEDEQLDCGDSQWIGAGDLLLRSCNLKSNDWPRVVIAAALGGRVYRADGAPSLLPVLEAAMSSDARAALPQADAESLLHAVQTKFPDAILRMAAADYESYGRLVESARLHSASHDYAAAETDYRHALSIEETLFGADSMMVGETVAELGLQASNQGRFDEAAALFRRARPIIEASANVDARAKLDSYMALDAANRRDDPAALAFASKATAARRDAIAAADIAAAPSNGSPIQPVGASRGELAHSLRIESEMALRLGDFARARASAEEALWIVSEEPGLPLWWRADTLALMGEINEAQGRVVQAEHDFRDARDLDLRLFADAGPTALSDFRLGEFYGRQQLYPAALDAFRAGFAIAGKDPLARADLQPDALVRFMAAAAAQNDKTIPDRDAEVFRVSQLPDTGVADQAIARIAVREEAGTPALADLIGRAQEATRDRDRAQLKLAAEYAKLDEERNAARENQLADDVKLASANADGLLAKVKADFPQYTSVAEPEPAQLAEVQSRLEPGEALLTYVIGTSSSYALLVKPKEFETVALPAGRDALAADVADLRRSLEPVLGRVQDFSLKRSHAVYDALIAPLRDRLTGVDHLIVVPGSVLANLPLALLVGEAPAQGHERDYLHADWLVRQFALSEVPSPRAFLSLRAERNRRLAPSRPFLGVGAPAFSGAPGGISGQGLAELTSGCRPDGPVSPSLLRALPPLPGTAAEVQTVGARIGGTSSHVLLGLQATESNFRAQPLGDYAVIYLATHGILPGELRCAEEPALALSPPERPTADTAADGLLNASEIAGLKLNADLVVLSACNTAVAANAFGGEALDGLSDAFFVAGARAVLASHWEVSSASTSALMTDLFDRARHGTGMAEALRDAQLSLIAQSATAHPFHWAAFTLMGDGGPLATNTQGRTGQTADATLP